MTATSATHVRTCPTCSEPVPSKAIGRPLIFCSVACRRGMEAMRRELLALGEEIAEARQLARDDFWPGERSWTARAQSLELAAAELRQRTAPATSHEPREYISRKRGPG